MNGIADISRGQRGIRLTDEDAFICQDRGHMEDYENAISDRNDAALMHALTIASKSGCRALRNRLAA